MATRKVLILGASYGSLLGVKLALAGHAVNLVCLPAEQALINAKGAVVRMPVKGREGLVEVNSKNLAGKLTASGPDGIDPKAFDMVVLAMQEPQYGQPAVRALLDAVGKAKVPCMSIMNMPPLPYLARVPGVDASKCRESYTDPTVWDNVDPKFLTLCSPDPQAFRPPEEGVNVLQVRLPTNFKAARFASDEHTSMLREIAESVEAARFEVNGEKIELPVKLKVHESVFVPLAKWAMLMAGNYRCVLADGVRPIKDAVHGNLEESRAVYNYVVDLCVSLCRSQRHGAVREVRERRAVAGLPFLGCARTGRWRSQHRARRPPRAVRGRAARQEIRGHRPDGRHRRFLARQESPQRLEELGSDHHFSCASEMVV